MSGVTVTIRGVEGLAAKFARLKAIVKTDAVPSALIDGGNDIAKSIASEAPKSTGFLRDHIDVKFSKKHGDLSPSVFIGPNSKLVYPDGVTKRKKGMPAFFVAIYIQFGHVLRTAILGYDSDDYTPKRGKLSAKAKRRGKKKIWRFHGDVAPNPFMDRGFAKSIAAVTEKIKKKIGQVIERVQ